MNCLTTLPHLLSIIPVKDTSYRSIIVLSTTLSVLYHYDESNIIINYIDHIIAFIWFLYDVYWAYKYTYKIIIVNVLSFVLYMSLDHNIWHLINASKCYYVSKQLHSIQMHQANSFRRCVDL